MKVGMICECVKRAKIAARLTKRSTSGIALSLQIFFCPQKQGTQYEHLRNTLRASVYQTASAERSGAWSVIHDIPIARRWLMPPFGASVCKHEVRVHQLLGFGFQQPVSFHCRRSYDLLGHVDGKNNVDWGSTVIVSFSFCAVSREKENWRKAKRQVSMSAERVTSDGSSINLSDEIIRLQYGASWKPATICT